MRITKLIIVISLIACVLIPGFFIGSLFIEKHKVYTSGILIDVIYTLVVTGLISSVNLLVIKRFLEKKYPWHSNKKAKRIIFELLFTNITSVTMITLFVIVLYYLYPVEIRKMIFLGQAIFQSIVVALIVNNIVAPVYEAQYLFREWINSKIEAEQLKREKAESQYAALRNQINPHFLFNSLNTLLTMVSENPKASRYIESLSDFLRYVLQTHDREAVSLQEELSMSNQYIFIQKTRFGDKLIVDTNIPQQYIEYAIPPFALQMLLENAIKHNVVSREYPLHIHVYTEDNYLTVENNIRRKSEENQSTGIGLANITNRFRFLSDRKVIISDENGKFKVSLPLVKMSL